MHSAGNGVKSCFRNGCSEAPSLLSTTEGVARFGVARLATAAGSLVAWVDDRKQMVVVLRRAGSGDPSLLSSIPGRPRERWRRLAGLCRAKGFVAVSVWSGGRHVYVRQAKGVRVRVAV